MDPRSGPTPPAADSSAEQLAAVAATPAAGLATGAAGLPPIGSPLNANPSVWVTLRHRGFRSLWLGSLVYFFANAMQTMAASWL